MNLLKGLARYVKVRRFERKYACRVYPGGQIQPNNRHLSESITVGSNTHIRGQLFTFGHGGRISMGSHCFVGENSKLWSAAEITIGDRVLIGHNSSIFDSDTHPMEASERHRHFVEIATKGWISPFKLREEPVRIEDDVWIGCNVVVLKGVTIGRGAVIGAGSVLTKDVPPYVVVVGNPARVVRELAQGES
jgi:acetyltransferase-like isoleucine patch superfamily enzyme